MTKFEKEAEAIFADFDRARDALADKIRREVVLPACRKFRVTFAAGNGSFSFYDLSYSSAFAGLIMDEHDCRAKKKTGLIRVLKILNTVCGEKFEIGHFVADVTEADLAL